jgi:hypothetical protein
VGDQTLVGAVKAAKRTSFYRENRHMLACAAPEEIWRDNDAGVVFVLFPVALPAGGFLGFAVRTADRQVVKSGMLSLHVVDGEWRARNEALNADGQAPEYEDIGHLV